MAALMAGGSIGDLKIDRSGEQTRSPVLGRVVGGLLLVVGLAFGIWYFAIPQHPTVQTVMAESVTQGNSGGTILNATGYVVARRAATVSSKVTGKIVEIFIEEGMSVTKGQLLARLDPVNVQVALDLAEAQWQSRQAATSETEVLAKEASLDLTRTQKLAESAIASQADLDAAQARLDSLRARLQRLQTEVQEAKRVTEVRQQDLEDLDIRAPFAGVVISKDAQPGEMISPVSAGGGFTRTGICTLVDMSSLEIEVDVNENYINRVTAGQPVEAVLNAYNDWRIQASVIAIVPTADRQKATVKVRIQFAELDPRILPEMGVKVSFQSPKDTQAVTPSRRLIRVENKTLFEENGRTYVWRVSNERIEKQAVTVRERVGDQALLEAGLSGGEVLIVNPPSGLANGQQVNVKNP